MSARLRGDLSTSRFLSRLLAAAGVALLNGVITPALAHGLRLIVVALALDGYCLGIDLQLGHGVLNLHHAVVELSIVVLLDRRRGRTCLVVDQRCGAQVLAKHVLVKVGVDEDAALREELVEVSDGDVVGVDVADFELALVESALRWLQLGDGLLEAQRLHLLLLIAIVVRVLEACRDSQ